MLAFSEINPPVRYFDVSGIMRALHQAADLFVTDLSALIALDEGGFALQEALDLGLSLKAPGGETVESLGNDRGVRLIPHQHLAVAAHLFIAKADRGMETPVAVHGARPHAVFGLLRVFLALMLRDGGQQVFNEDGVRILAKVDRRAFQLAACFFQGAAQHPVAFNIAGKAADIINDNDNAARALHFNKGQKRTEGRAVKHPAGHGALFEDFDHVIALAISIFATAGGLRL